MAFTLSELNLFPALLTMLASDGEETLVPPTTTQPPAP